MLPSRLANSEPKIGFKTAPYIIFEDIFIYYIFKRRQFPVRNVKVKPGRAVRKLLGLGRAQGIDLESINQNILCLVFHGFVLLGSERHCREYW